MDMNQIDIDVNISYTEWLTSKPTALLTSRGP